MDNNLIFFGSDDRIKSKSTLDEDSDQLSDFDESEGEVEEEAMDEERDEENSDDSVVDEELEDMVEKAFCRSSRLQQLLEMNEKYKSSNSLFIVDNNSDEESRPEPRTYNCTECSFKIHNSEELETHLKTHNLNAKTGRPVSKAFQQLAKDLIKCSECEEWFTTEEKLSLHIKKSHNKAVLNCDKCEFTARDLNTYVRHSEIHQNQGYSCPECSSRFPQLKELRQHTEEEHKRVNCDKCEKSFKLQSSLSEHMKRFHGKQEEPVLQCPICCHKYNCRTRYEKHVQSHDSSNRFHCHLCVLSFEKAVALEVHKNRDHLDGQKPYVCDICDQRFYANEKLLNHLSNKHKMAVYGCEWCDYKTNSKYKMARHRLIHSADRFKCNHEGCQQIFDTKYNLIIHKKSHSMSDELFLANDFDNNSNNSMSKKSSNSNISSDGFQSNSKTNGSETTEDNTRDFFPVADFLQIDLKSGDNEENVIQLDDSSNDEYNESEKEFNCSECGIGFEMKNDLKSHMICSHSLNSDKSSQKPTQTPLVTDILQKDFNQNSKNFSIVYNKNKNSVLINQNCGKTNVMTIQRTTERFDQEMSEEEDNEEEEDEESEQKYCTIAGCQAFFTDKKAFRDHILSVHKLIKCNKCEKCFQSFSGLYKHKRRYHRSQRQIVCRFCDKKFFYQTSYEKHIETHDRPLEEDPEINKFRENVVKTYSCYDCNELFVERDKYLKHLSKFHSIPAFKCDLCDYKSMSKKLLASHLVRHSTVKPFKCDVNDCDMTFKSKNSLQIHKRVKHQIHSQQRFVCQWTDCGKQFSIKQLFDYHQLSHSHPRDDVCDQNSNTSTSIDVKKNSQSDDGVHCLISGCDKVCADKQELNEHMKTKHDLTIEPITTSAPKGTTISQTNHNSTPERRFVCPLPDCGKHLVTKQALEYHMAATHMGVKPFVCQWKGCDYRTVTEPRLKMHTRTHTKPLNCPIPGCSKVFAMNRDIKRHLQNKHKNLNYNYESISDWNQMEDSLNDTDMSQSFIESNVISIEEQNCLEIVKQEPNDESSNDILLLSADQNNGLELNSMDMSSENSNYSLITELMRKRYETSGLDNNYIFKSVVSQSTGYWTQDSSDSQSFDTSFNQNLLCFECNLTFGSYDLLYRHNNEFHNKYKPKYK